MSDASPDLIAHTVGDGDQTPCAEAAEAILHDGFSDSTGSHGLVGASLTGVFVSDEPLDAEEGADGDSPLVVTVPVTLDLSTYELVEDGKPYREWRISANVINE